MQPQLVQPPTHQWQPFESRLAARLDSGPIRVRLSKQQWANFTPEFRKQLADWIYERATRTKRKHARLRGIARYKRWRKGKTAEYNRLTAELRKAGMYDWLKAECNIIAERWLEREEQLLQQLEREDKL